MLTNIKKGNFYQISKQSKDSITKLDDSTAISLITINLDPESKHFESSVLHLMDAVGTIGGILELILTAMLI